MPTPILHKIHSTVLNLHENQRYVFQTRLLYLYNMPIYMQYTYLTISQYNMPAIFLPIYNHQSSNQDLARISTS